MKCSLLLSVALLGVASARAVLGEKSPPCELAGTDIFRDRACAAAVNYPCTSDYVFWLLEWY